jgi:ABC-2 type transport system ATP-binding protein
MTEAVAPNRIEARGLTKHFGSVQAVSDLSFSVEPGSVTGFLGPNGAGKTTTLRMILGLAKPDSGEATIGGRHYADLADPTRTVGAVLESNSFHPGRTALNHLRIYCAAAGLPDSRANEVLAEVGLADFAGRRAGGFSLGMRQRLALATALLGNPSVLVLDEPTNGLDPEGVAWLRGFLRNIADQRQCAVLVSSHLLAEVEQTVDRIVILARGRLVRQGTLAELRSGAAGSVSVRGPDLVGLRSAITVIGPHVTVSAANGESLNVTGATAEQIGRAAWSKQLELHQLVTENVSLEEVFLELTADKAIRGSEVAGL